MGVVADLVLDGPVPPVSASAGHWAYARHGARWSRRSPEAPARDTLIASADHRRAPTITTTRVGTTNAARSSGCGRSSTG